MVEEFPHCHLVFIVRRYRISYQKQEVEVLSVQLLVALLEAGYFVSELLQVQISE